MKRTAFVTGASGFVGSNLCEELLAQGWRVIAMHRASVGPGHLASLPVETVLGDVTDYRTLRAALPERVDALFHVAGNTSLWARHRAEQLKVNVKGTRNVVRAALNSGAKRLIHTSSLVAYGLHDGTITEDTPPRGLGSTINYVRSKALAEREVRIGIGKGLDAVILNPGHVIGRHDLRNWSRVFRLVDSGQLPTVPGGGGSFCHVRSVVRAHVAAVDRGRSGANYVLGGADSSYIGLVRMVARMRGERARVLPVPLAALKLMARVDELLSPLLRREPDLTRDALELLSTNLYCRNTRAVAELGYEPKPLAEILDDCHRWLIDSGRLKPPSSR